MNNEKESVFTATTPLGVTVIVGVVTICYIGYLIYKIAAHGILEIVGPQLLLFFVLVAVMLILLKNVGKVECKFIVKKDEIEMKSYLGRKAKKTRILYDDILSIDSKDPNDTARSITIRTKDGDKIIVDGFDSKTLGDIFNCLRTQYRGSMSWNSDSIPPSAGE